MEVASLADLKMEVCSADLSHAGRQPVLARLVVGFMAADIMQEINGGLSPQLYSDLEGVKSVVPCRPPTSSQFHLQLMMDMPLPFEAAPFERFNVCHLERMRSKAFLEDGEWVGYYCYPSRHLLASLILDPPMRGVCFQARDECEDGLVHLRADGFDAIGSFQLVGTLEAGSGDINMLKTYPGARSWRWCGSMTPFGIVGSWGAYNAWFWLWKADWCR